MREMQAVRGGEPQGADCHGEQLVKVFPPSRAAAARMRAALRTYLERQAVDAVVVYQVVLAADEAFCNAVTHASGGGRIRVSASVSEREAAVEVRDGGTGFVLLGNGPREVPDVSRPHGRGVFLIETMMDSVTVESSCRGTTVRMVKRLAG